MDRETDRDAYLVAKEKHEKRGATKCVTAHQKMFGEVILPIPLREVLHHNSQKKTKFHKTSAFVMDVTGMLAPWYHETGHTVATCLCFHTHKHLLQRHMRQPVTAYAATPPARG